MSNQKCLNCEHTMFAIAHLNKVSVYAVFFFQVSLLMHSNLFAITSLILALFGCVRILCIAKTLQDNLVCNRATTVYVQVNSFVNLKILSSQLVNGRMRSTIDILIDR